MRPITVQGRQGAVSVARTKEGLVAVASEGIREPGKVALLDELAVDELLAAIERAQKASSQSPQPRRSWGLR